MSTRARGAGSEERAQPKRVTVWQSLTLIATVYKGVGCVYRGLEKWAEAAEFSAVSFARRQAEKPS